MAPKRRHNQSDDQPERKNDEDTNKRQKVNEEDNSSSSSSSDSSENSSHGSSENSSHSSSENSSNSSSENSSNSSSDDKSSNNSSSGSATPTDSSDSDFIVDDEEDDTSESDQDSSSNSDDFIVDDEDDDEKEDQERKFKGMIIIPLSSLFGPNFGSRNDNHSNNQEDEDEFDDDGDELDQPNEEPPSFVRRNLRKRKARTPAKPPKKAIKRRKIDITENIKTLDDLLAIIDKYEDKPNLEYPLNMQKLKALKDPIIELQNLVGMEEIKNQILDQIMFLLSQLQDDDQMLHTVVYGPPGSGKSTLGLILSKVYQALGYSNGKFRIVKRSDLIAGYLGQTALKTQRLFNETSGGVIFIDEAYSLGNAEGRDSFSKEAIDTINQNLTEMKTKIICIIAGYKEELEKCFFSVNPGLNRRFPFRYEIKEYGYRDLAAIFNRKITLSGWTVDTVPVSLFEDNQQYFTQKGGDMEILSQMSKLAYSRRTFGKHQDPKKHLTLEDVQEGLKLFKLNDEVKNRPNTQDHETYFQNNIKPYMYN